MRKTFDFTDLTGQKFGRWTVMGRATDKKGGNTKWKCTCECGNSSTITGSSLQKGESLSCGCIRRGDLTGQKFGRLSVLSRAKTDRRRRACWHCKCECGKECVVVGTFLKKGATRSCGCLFTESHVRHGMRNSPEYIVWKGMIQRCKNPSHQAYASYGGRGIGVCERWLNFENFFADMGKRPDGTSLDRINNNGDYVLDNCRWATLDEQNRNKRNNRYIVIDGEKITIAEYARRSGISRQGARYRLLNGKIQEEQQEVDPNIINK